MKISLTKIQHCALMNIYGPPENVLRIESTLALKTIFKNNWASSEAFFISCVQIYKLSKQTP